MKGKTTRERNPARRLLSRCIERGIGRLVRGKSGLALIATLVLVVLIAVMVAASVQAALNATRTASADYRQSRTFYAAEAAGEAMLADLRIAVQDGVITNDELATLSPPDLPGFDFSGHYVDRIGGPRVEKISDGPYAGLLALTESFEIRVTATDPSGSQSAILLGVRSQAIPIFQFGVFYEEDLEIHPGPPMDFLGRIHGNSRVYLNANEARFHEPITTPSTVIANYKHKVVARDGVWIKDASGTNVLLKFDSRQIPEFQAFKTRSCNDFDCRLQTNAFGVRPLTLPLPDGMPPREIVRPKEIGDGALEQQTKLSWLADTYVTVDLDDIKSRDASCNDGSTAKYPSITVERPLGGAVPDNVDKCKIFEWFWEGFVDSREKKPVDVLDIDINELKNWVTADPTNNGAKLIYVEVIPNTGGSAKPPETDETDDDFYPAVRIKNGQELPGPLTIGTDQPLYVWGDYNTVNKQPAAVGGDAYHVLSNAWDDSQHQIIREHDDAGLTIAAPTTINVAILAGHSATTCDINEDPGCITADYGGGFENYPRFLEKWSSVEYTYRGSIVSLWTAVFALGKWYRSSEDYYKPPVRNWGFDLDLLDPAKMPPGTPVVGAVLRVSFREVY